MGSPSRKPLLGLLLLFLASGCGRIGFELVDGDRASSSGGDGLDAGRGASANEGGVGSGGGSGATSASSGADGAVNAGAAGDANVGGSGGDASSNATSGGGSDSGAACPNAIKLLHRYRFDGTGTSAIDDIGRADGQVRGATLDGSGVLTLDGGGDYVDLPSGLISSQAAVTIEMWVEWASGAHHQVLFDVGATEEGPDLRGTPVSHAQLKVSTPQTGFSFAFVTPNESTNLNVSPLLQLGEVEQVVVVLDAVTETLSLYRSGVLLGSRTLPSLPLADLDDVDFWLGGALDASDNDFRGDLHDVRIYAGALNDCQVEAAQAQGPDALPSACACP